MTSSPESSPAGRPDALPAQSLAASITVRDLRESLAWYRDAVGFAVDREMERDGVVRSVALQAGGVRLLLNQDDGAQGADRALGAGVSLMITVADVDAVARRIREAGATLDSEPADMPWGARTFRVRDPNGYRFAFSTPR